MLYTPSKHNLDRLHFPSQKAVQSFNVFDMVGAILDALKLPSILGLVRQKKRT